MYYEFEKDDPFRQEILKFIKTKWKENFLWDEWCISKIFENGDLNILMWVRENSMKPIPYSDISSVSAYCGYFDILVWMKDIGIPLNIDLDEMCVLGGNLDILKWLCSIQYDINYTRIKELAKDKGHSKILEFINSRINA